MTLVSSAPRVEIGGVPVDSVDMDGALGRALDAVGARTFMQVCTVNLDFLVSAQRDSEVRSILRESHLNLADGAPVMWLGRLLGRPIRERVAGADFIPRLMERAARSGARVFLLGGEHGAAADAAERLVERYPGLVIAGTYEPPRSDLEDMDDEEILLRLRASRSDVLLVAFGHPKQEMWIKRQGDRLPTTVAVGVGCTFELIAGRRRRAPRWMRISGLEWLFRALHEPRRLVPRYLADAWCLGVVLVPAILRQRHAEARP